MGRSRHAAGRGRQGLRHLSVCEWSSLGFLANSNQKKAGHSVKQKSQRGLRSSQGEGCGRQGRPLIGSVLGRLYQELTFPCDYGDQGMHLHGSLVSVLRPPQVQWPNKKDAIPWSSLTKLSRTHRAMQCHMGVAPRSRVNSQGLRKTSGVVSRGLGNP